MIPERIPVFPDNPDVNVVYGHRAIVNQDDLEIGRWVMPPHEKDGLLRADYIPQETLFRRRSAWRKAGGYVDESFHFALDEDYGIRSRDAEIWGMNEK